MWSVCDKQVLTIGGLKKHIQSEHEDVKYPCNQCNYQFTQQASLKKHMKIHKHMNNEQVESSQLMINLNNIAIFAKWFNTFDNKSFQL